MSCRYLKTVWAFKLYSIVNLKSKNMPFFHLSQKECKNSIELLFTYVESYILLRITKLMKKNLNIAMYLPYSIIKTLVLRKHNNSFHIIFFKHLYWCIIALQWCVSFCCITKWISYTYTYIPIPPPSCVSLPPSLSHPSRWSESPKLISLCYAAASH